MLFHTLDLRVFRLYIRPLDLDILMLILPHPYSAFQGPRVSQRDLSSFPSGSQEVGNGYQFLWDSLNESVAHSQAEMEQWPLIQDPHWSHVCIALFWSPRLLLFTLLLKIHLLWIEYLSPLSHSMLNP